MIMYMLLPKFFKMINIQTVRLIVHASHSLFPSYGLINIVYHKKRRFVYYIYNTYYMLIFSFGLRDHPHITSPPRGGEGSPKGDTSI